MPPHPTQHLSEFLRGAEHLNKHYQHRDSVTLTRSGNPSDSDKGPGSSEEAHGSEDDPR